ncbi:unnamed protein product [Amoebophrya sp. A25]|nr:unnamed protein product [Amoebophrya sp. A25]|eukprot:GSA25T00019772001.1
MEEHAPLGQLQEIDGGSEEGEVVMNGAADFSKRKLEQFLQSGGKEEDDEEELARLPLLRLLSQLLTAGETQVNVTRAATLPLLGALASILENRNFSTLPACYSRLLARLLVYNEAVLRDASHTIAEQDLEPYVNIAKQASSASLNLHGQQQSNSSRTSASTNTRRLDPDVVAAISSSSHSEGEARVPKGFPSTSTATRSVQTASFGRAAPTSSPTATPGASLSRAEELSQSSAFVRLTTLCFLERHPALASSVAFALVSFLDKQARQTGARVAKKTKNKDAKKNGNTGANAAAAASPTTFQDGSSTNNNANQQEGFKPLVPNNLSDYHRAQLRAWQAIVVLLNVMEPHWLAAIVPRIMWHFGLPQLPDVRSYMEYALCVLAEREQRRREDIGTKMKTRYNGGSKAASGGRVSEYFTRELTRILDEVGTGTPQVLASAILVAGYWAERTQLLPRELLLNTLLVPYLTSNVALVRGTAQLVYYRLCTMSGITAASSSATNPAPAGERRLVNASRRITASRQQADGVSSGEVVTCFSPEEEDESTSISFAEDQKRDDRSGSASRTNKTSTRLFKNNETPAPASGASRANPNHAAARRGSSPRARPTSRSPSPASRTALGTREQDQQRSLQFHHAQQLLRMLTEHKDSVKMRQRLEQNLDSWAPWERSQISTLFNNRDAVYDYRPNWMFLQEMKQAIDVEMQGLWHKHTEADEALKVGPAGYIWLDESEGLLEDLRRKVAVAESGSSAVPQESVQGQLLAEDQKTMGEQTSATGEQVEVQLQRKFDPFAGSAGQLDELFLSLGAADQASDQKSGRERSNLIVCASLIDKIPNLAGLCRTCEIFSAEALVVNNKDCVKDPSFTSVSVTAERWQPLLEVPILDDLLTAQRDGRSTSKKYAKLAEFLSLQQQLGYKIVAVEQTHSSECLSKFRFPQKSILLLGAEKEGLPAELLHLCDSCVEIPQTGIIRSLNVHVSAAMCVWEYTKQHCVA